MEKFQFQFCAVPGARYRVTMSERRLLPKVRSSKFRCCDCEICASRQRGGRRHNVSPLQLIANILNVSPPATTTLFDDGLSLVIFLHQSYSADSLTRYCTSFAMQAIVHLNQSMTL